MICDSALTALSSSYFLDGTFELVPAVPGWKSMRAVSCDSGMESVICALRCYPQSKVVDAKMLVYGSVFVHGLGIAAVIDAIKFPKRNGHESHYLMRCMGSRAIRDTVSFLNMTIAEQDG